MDLEFLAGLEFLVGLVGRSDLSLLADLGFPVGLVPRLPLSLLGFLEDLMDLEFLGSRLDLCRLVGLEFLGDLVLQLPPLLLGFLGDLEYPVDQLDLSLLEHLGFLAGPVNPSLRLLPLLLLLLSLQLSLSPRYLLLLLSHLLLLSGQVVHLMDLSLLPDLMAPLGRSVLLVLLTGQSPLLDRLLLLDR